MILLVRHPPVDAGGRCYGRLDLAADPADVTSLAAELRARLRRSHAGKGPRVWTSPARRCCAVAAALGAHTVDDRLQELNFGDWEGLRWDDVPRASLDAWAADPWGFAAPGGESGAELVARVRAFAAEFAAECAAAPCVVITHGGPLKVLGPVLLGTEVRLLAAAPPPGSVRSYAAG